MKNGLILHFYAPVFFMVLATSLGAQIVEFESTTQGLLPPRMSTAERDAIPVSTESNGLVIFNITTSRLNYYDSEASQWFELHPGAHSMSIIDYFRSLPNGIQTLLDAGEIPLNILNEGASTTDFIGLNYAGGIIFYMLSDGTGLVAADTDQSEGAPWGCMGIAIDGANGVSIGSGLQNTLDIENQCTDLGTAADICAKLILNGYTDWFLPSKDELAEMYSKIGQGANEGNENIGGFGNAYYWSSTQFGLNMARSLIFQTGLVVNNDKDANFRVRAIRAF